MSIYPRTFFCTNCNFEATHPFDGSLIYYYKNSGGDVIYAPTGVGWCSDCNTIVPIQLGISNRILNNEILDSEKQLEKINQNFFSKILQSRKGIQKGIAFSIKKKRDLLSVLNGNDSIQACLKCNGANVVSLSEDNGKVVLSNKSPFIHSCGGDIQMKTEKSYRFYIESEGVLIKPVHKTIKKINFFRMNNIKSTDEIPYFNYIRETLIDLLVFERTLMINNNDKLHGFKCQALIDKAHRRDFILERFFFVYSLCGVENWPINLELMKEYLIGIVQLEYNITTEQSYLLTNNRIEFYKLELELITKSNYPYPGKIIWSLYNPSYKTLSHDLTVDCEKNFLASIFLFHHIVSFIENKLTSFRT
jgi:hypothetical protein